MKLPLHVLPAMLLLVAPSPAQQGPRTLDALLRRFDTDHDGRVSAEEYGKRPFLFRRMDKDGDGYLSAADFPDAPGKSAPAASVQPAAEAKPPSAEEIEFFEKRVRPVLAAACFECHSASAPKLKGGLRVDSREALLQGGASGPAILPGDKEASPLVQAVRYTDPDFQMPPKKPLPEESVRDLERWVELGAPWPGEVTSRNGAGAKEPIDFAKAREFWSFRPVTRVEPPATKDASWAWSDIDRFLLAAMQEKGVTPVGDAERGAWLRRVSFDLTGLPPTPEELAAFEKDRSPAAFEAVVDRLLAAPGFGERWGRHWLDVARYAESSGKETNVLFPHAWRYRDWVIAAFSADKPYDLFLKEQLAGDLLPAANDDERAQQLVATGYLALGSKSLNTRDRRQFALDVADEQIDAFSQGMLGLTISCARCHDHKFDPIPIEDYYSVAGILLSTETRYGTHRGPGNNQPADLIELPRGAHVPDGPSMSAAQRGILERLSEGFARNAGEGAPERGKSADGKKPDPQELLRQRNAREQQEMIDALLARFDEQGRPLPANRLAMGAVEGRPRDVPVLERGELDKAGATVHRGVLQVLPAGAPRIERGSGRRELADWVASPANPLTARVWANRVWLHLFGTGLVRSPDNFGASGQRPDHPELLDWLASELVAQGWSTKKLVREIVLSHAYRLASRADPAGEKRDPDVLTLWRMPERRLDAESIRDAMLSAAGTLERTPPTGSPAGTLEGVLRREELVATITQDRPVRSVYLPMLRDHLPDALDVFDVADPSFVTGDRDETNVATQALYLMNDADVLRTADAFAGRLLALEASDERRITRAFELALGRAPEGSELALVQRFLREFPGQLRADDGGEGERRGRRGQKPAPEPKPAAATDAKRAAWSAFAQSLFQCAEFRIQS